MKTPKKNTRKAKKILYAIIIGLVVVLAVLIGVVALSGDDEEPQADLQPTPVAAFQTVTEAPAAATATPVPTEEPATATPAPEATPTVAPDPTTRITPTPVPEPEPTVEVVEPRGLSVQTPYLTLELTDTTGKLTYDQSTMDDAYTVSFYMMKGEEKIPVYRLILNDAETGSWLGRLVSEEADVSVTYLAYTIQDEEMAQTYAALMELFSKILNDIGSDPRFVPEKPLAVGADQGVSLEYWNLDLPSDITWQETAEGNSYTAVFSGTIQGQTVPLYCVRIGDNPVQTILGQYQMGGETLPLSVETYDLPTDAGWSEEDTSLAYHLMNTINDLIQAIMASDGFVAAQ